MSDSRDRRAARAEQMRKDREKGDKRQRNVITVVIVVVVVALIALGGWAVTSAGSEAKVVQPRGLTDGGIGYPPNEGIDNSTSPG